MTVSRQDIAQAVNNQYTSELEELTAGLTTERRKREMKKGNLEIIAINVKAENGKGHKNNCTTRDLLNVLQVLDCPLEITITVLGKK